MSTFQYIEASLVCVDVRSKTAPCLLLVRRCIRPTRHIFVDESRPRLYVLAVSGRNRVLKLASTSANDRRQKPITMKRHNAPRDRCSSFSAVDRSSTNLTRISGGAQVTKAAEVGAVAAPTSADPQVTTNKRSAPLSINVTTERPRSTQSQDTLSK